MILIAAAALGVGAGTAGRSWVAQFTGPGLAVLKGMGTSTRRAVPQKAAPPVQKVAVGKKAAVPPATPAKLAAQVKTATSSPARLVTATLTISSTPGGAQVQINGVARGTTPVTVTDLRAGPHKIRITHQGHRAVTRTVRLEAGVVLTVAVTLPLQPPPKVAARSEGLVSASPQPSALIEVGRPAPQFVAKDRVGILYNTAHFRGRKLIVVFVQQLDGEARRVIREMNALQAGGARGAALAVVLRPDRTSIRQFTQSDQIQIPVLFGTQALGRAYGVGSQTAVLYVVSEEGRVLLRQVGRVNPRAALN